MQQAINENCIPKISENTTVSVSTLGKHAELIGAASLVMEHLETVDVPVKSRDFNNVLS